MAWFRRRKGPFAHEMDSFHVDLQGRQPGAPRLVTGTSEAAGEGRGRSDLTIAALGITLALICALFPWYIFFNQEQFGVRAMKFEGGGTPSSGPKAVGPQPQRVGAPMSVEDLPVDSLDLFATGTVRDNSNGDDPPPPGLDEQPFPAEIPRFRLVHVANGRAMIEDDAGLWIVQPGSQLPDSSTVTAIERRSGKWVLVTSAERVVEMAP
jgi:hypothetical protein